MNCRLCGGHLRERFRLRVLQQYDVQYAECQACGSLQTEEPYWLHEAYQCSLSTLDTGAAQRNLNNCVAAYVAHKLYRVANVVDFGGGDGLLCRLLRDLGINCYVQDAYATASYAQGYSEPDFARPDMVMAFEVLEHLPQPTTALDALFAARPAVVLASTAVYAGEPADWWYLAPASGQHVFFYSAAALDLIAARYGYRLLRSGAYIVFTRNDRASAWRTLIAKMLLKGKAFRLIRALLTFLPTPGIAQDYADQSAKAGTRPTATARSDSQSKLR
jgi:Methyltransferase domain